MVARFVVLVGLACWIGCSGDTTPPEPPVLTSVTPDSPANENGPTVGGTAEADATVEVFADANCAATAAIGEADGAGSFAIVVMVADDSVTELSARAIDAAGNVSDCSTAPLTYTEDSIPPPMPDQLASNPAARANNNTPVVTGVTEAGATVGVYTDAACMTSVGGSPADATGAFTVTATLADDVSVSLYADARDAAGNRSPCSTTWLSYVEDSTAPALSSLVMSPGSPGADTTPDVTGTTEAAAAVALFTDAACATQAAVTTADGSGAFVLPATVGDDTTTTFYVRLTDAAGNVSACSSGVTYVHNRLPVLQNVPLTIPCIAATQVSFKARALDTAADMASLVFSEGAGSTCAFAGQAVAANGTVSGTCAFPAGNCTIEIVVSDGLQSTTGVLTVGAPVFHDVDFMAPRAFVVGDGPSGIAAADLNGDGRLDLAVANEAAGTVSVLFRDATVPRAHMAGPTLVAGTAPSAIAVGDVNMDGRADIIVANSGSANVSVFLQSAVTAGTFAAAVPYDVGTTPRAIAIGDLDGDNRLDLAVANQGTNNVSVLMQHATIDGTFVAAVPLAAGTAPKGIALGDINGDGYRDIIVANSGSANASLIRQNAAAPGTFLAATTVGAGNGPSAVAVADLNADGRLDLAITNDPAYTVSVRLQDAVAAGSFPTVATYTANQNPSAIAVADVTGDARPDLIVTNTYGHDVYVFAGDSVTAGTFQAATAFRMGFRPSGVATGDFDGDGRVELAVANNGSDNVFVLHRDPDVVGGFLAPRGYASGSSGGSTAIADLDGDDNLDIVASSAGGDNLRVLLQSTSMPREFTGTTIPSGDNPSGVAAADLNADGHPDLVAACFIDDTVRLRFNSAGTPGTFPTTSTLSSIDGAGGVAVGDVNNDNRPDLVVTGYYSPVYVYLHSTVTAGSFQTRASYAMTGNPMSPTLVDVNNDTRPDIVVTNRANHTISIMLQSSTVAGTFLTPTTKATGTNPVSIVTADFNTDGFPDLAIANYGSNDVTVYLHDAASPGSFLAANTVAVGVGPTELAVGDLNGDLRPDLLTTGSDSSTWSVLLNDPASPGAFLAAQVYGAAFSAGGANIGDIDGDGLPDLIAIDPYGSSLRIAWQR